MEGEDSIQSRGSLSATDKPSPFQFGVWYPIETVPNDTTVILANFDAMCLLTGAPHVWTATYVTKWVDGHGKPVDDLVLADPMWCECSHAATNENGEPTHWTPLPEPPSNGDGVDEPKSDALD